MQSTNLLARAAMAGLALLGFSVTAAAQGRVEKNVVYGMYSGSALLLDVHYPAQPNGFGIVFIAGSGWNAALGYAAAPLKESPQVEMYVPSLTQAGYTVFAVTHRATPAFRFPAPARGRTAGRPFHQTQRGEVRNRCRHASVALEGRRVPTWSACWPPWTAPATQAMLMRSTGRAPSSNALSHEPLRSIFSG